MDFKLRGRITEKESGTGVAGVLVLVRGREPSGEALARCVSQLDGTFELRISIGEHAFARDSIQSEGVVVVVTTRDGVVELYRSPQPVRIQSAAAQIADIRLERAALARGGVSQPLHYAAGPEIARHAEHHRLATMHQATGTREYLAVVDPDIHIELDRIEKLIGQRHFGQALRDLEAVKPGDSPLREYYVMRRETLRAKSCCRIAAVYALEGQTDDARFFYRKALGAAGTDVHFDDSLQVQAMAMIDQGFAARVKDRRGLIEAITATATRRPPFGACEDRGRLKRSSFFDDVLLQGVDLSRALEPGRWRQQVEGSGGEPLPGPRRARFGLIDSPPEEWGVHFTTEAGPGGLVQYAGTDTPMIDVNPLDTRQRMKAAYVMPLAHVRLQAHAGLLALERAVDIAGEKRQAAPLFRYNHLRERVLGMLERLDQVERKMIDLQLSLDDFAQAKAEINNVLGDTRAELAALENRIDKLVDDLATVKSLEEEVGTARQELKHYQEECDTEWWEIVLGVALVVVLTAVGAVVGAFIGNIPGAVGGATLGFAIAMTATQALGIWAEAPVDCENVDQAEQAFSEALSEIRRGRRAIEDELEVALAQRDVVQAETAALQYKIQAAVEANAARHLNAKTTAAILSTYEETRQHVLNQATVLAQKLESSYRFEHGHHWRRPSDRSGRLIARSYGAPEGKGYGARERLLKDVESLEFLRLTGRTGKAAQLTQTVSLRQHYPAALVAFKLGAKAAFTVTQERFDDWYPGTYLHRVREARVEVLVDGAPSPARGYLSSFGASYVRFRDPGDEVPADGRSILREPDPDIRRLCYKRAAQLGVHDTTAFPEMHSVRAHARAARRQAEERNAFEGMGLGATFTLELLPDQPVDVERISDVLVHLQVEAEFDAQLQRVLEEKRFKDRRHLAQISARKMCVKQGRTFTPGNIVFDLRATAFPYPYRGKLIQQLALMIVPKVGDSLTGTAELKVQRADEQPCLITTDDSGRAACGKARHAGPSGETIKAEFTGKDPIGRWSLSTESLPPGVDLDDVDDVLLFLRYGFAEAE